MRVRIRKNYIWKKLIFFLSKTACIKDFQAAGEAFSPQKRTASSSIHTISDLFLFSWVIFALLDSDPINTGRNVLPGAAKEHLEQRIPFPEEPWRCGR
jgi:hypothetical protein